MKPYRWCLAGLLVLICALAGCGQEERELVRLAEDSFQNAQNIYYKMLEFDAYGGEYPVYFSSLDDDIVPYLTNSLTALHAFSFADYRETTATAQDQERADSFYLDCPEKGGLLKVTVGANQQLVGVDLREATMVLTICMADDEENAVHLEGRLLRYLVEVARVGGALQTIYRAPDCVALYYSEDEGHVLPRGTGRALEVLIELVLEHETPVEDADPAFEPFEVELSLSGERFLLDVEGGYIQRVGEEAVYPVTEESLTDFLAWLPVLESAEEPAAEGISSLLPAREAVQEVFVLIGVNIPVATDEEAAEALLDELYGADLSGFREADPSEGIRAYVFFFLRTADGETQVMVSHDSDGQYLFITDPELRQQFLRGPADAFDWAALDRLRGEVLRNTQDPPHSGRVELPDSGFSASVSKGNSARARSTLDDAAATAEGGGESPCDILFEVDDVLYGINSDTGEFYRQEAGETVWARLDSGELMSVKVSLGVLSATS